MVHFHRGGEGHLWVVVPSSSSREQHVGLDQSRFGNQRGNDNKAKILHTLRTLMVVVWVCVRWDRRGWHRRSRSGSTVRRRVRSWRWRWHVGCPEANMFSVLLLPEVSETHVAFDPWEVYT